MKYNSETPQHILTKYINRVDSRWMQLNDLVLSIVADGIKYLFYVNAGGCIAVIAFIGTSESIRQLNWPWYVLGLFFIGVLFVGILNLARYHVVDSLQKNWQKDVSLFYEGNLDFDVMNNRDSLRVEKTHWILWFVYLSFSSFIAGGAVGFFNYHELVKGKPEMIEKSTSTPNLLCSDKKDHVPKQPPMPPQPRPPK